LGRRNCPVAMASFPLPKNNFDHRAALCYNCSGFTKRLFEFTDGITMRNYDIELWDVPAPPQVYYASRDAVLIRTTWFPNVFLNGRTYD
jgi:hypothetical protein